jgi:hypothetical protein
MWWLTQRCVAALCFTRGLRAHHSLLLCSSQILAYVNRVKDVDSNVDHATFTMHDVESNIVRCPDQVAALKMIDGASAGGNSKPVALLTVTSSTLPLAQPSMKCVHVASRAAARLRVLCVDAPRD